MRARKTFMATTRHPITGKRLRVRAATPRELESKLHLFDRCREDIREGGRPIEEVDRDLRRMIHGLISVERAARAYAARPEFAQQTRRNVSSFIAGAGAVIASRPIDSLIGNVLRPWIETLQRRGYASSTIDQAWRMLRAVAAYASERGWMGAAPWGTWKPKLRARKGARPQREAARSIEEVCALLVAAYELDTRARDRGGWVVPPASEYKILCAVSLGLRQGELAGLRWTDLRRLLGTVAIVRQWDGAPLKTGAPSELAAPVEFFETMDLYRVRLEVDGLFDPAGPIFPGPDSTPGAPRPYTRGEVLTRRDLRAAVGLAGLPDVQRWSAHSLRDTFVGLEERAHGGDLAKVAMRSRHRSLSALWRYLHARDRGPAPPGFRLPLTRRPPELNGGTYPMLRPKEP